MLRALRGENLVLTVIVSIAYEREQQNKRGHEHDDELHDDELQQRLTVASVEDLRRSLEALSEGEGTLLRAIRRPLTIERLGRHPLGNLMIASTAAAFDDYGRASIWLGEQLGIAGAVLPATTEPVGREIEEVEVEPSKRSAGAERMVPRLRLTGDRLDSPRPAVRAIEQARWAILAPGSLYRSVLSTAAVPDLVSALRRTPARVLWIANLETDSRDAFSMTSIDHVVALRDHGVRVDMVLCDPSAPMRFDPAELAGYGVKSVERELRSREDPARHDPGLLRSALTSLMGPRLITEGAG